MQQSDIDAVTLRLRCTKNPVSKSVWRFDGRDGAVVPVQYLAESTWHSAGWLLCAAPLQFGAWRFMRVTSMRIRPNERGCPMCRADLYVGEEFVAPVPMDWRSEGHTDGLPPLLFGSWIVRKAGPCACSGRCLDVEAWGTDTDGDGDQKMFTFNGQRLVTGSGNACLWPRQ